MASAVRLQKKPHYAVTVLGEIDGQTIPRAVKTEAISHCGWNLKNERPGRDQPRSRPKNCGSDTGASLMVSLERLWVTQTSVRPGEVENVTRVLARTPDHIVVGVIPEVGDDVGADGKPVGRDIGDAAIGGRARGSRIHAERSEQVGER